MKGLTPVLLSIRLVATPAKPRSRAEVPKRPAQQWCCTRADVSETPISLIGTCGAIYTEGEGTTGLLFLR